MDVEAYTRWSPHLVKCCLLLSANESYARAAEDIEVLTGIAVPHSTQQRFVHRQTFEETQVLQVVAEMSVDGGKVRLRTPGNPVNGEIIRQSTCTNLLWVRFSRTTGRVIA